MEKFDHRRFGKSRKSKKKDHKHESKLPKKKRDDKLFAGLKKHQTAHDVLHKITSGRLTVRHGMFQNAIRSDIVTKEQTSLLRDGDRAVLNEDLFQLLDIADRDTSATKRLKQNSTKTSRVSSDFDSTRINQSVIDIAPTEQQEEEYGSIFRDIEEQYNNIATNNNNNSSNIATDNNNTNNIENNCDLLDKDNDSLLEQDQVLRQLVYKYVHAPVTDPRDKYYQEKLAKLCTKDPAQTLIEGFLNELNNKQPTTEDINWPDCTMEPHAAYDTPPRSSGYQPPAVDNVQPALPMEVERCRTPENQPVAFPEASYHTPENQKYTLRHPESMSSSCKYEAGIYVVPEDYRSAIRDDHLLQQQLNLEFNPNSPDAGNQPLLYHMDMKEHFNITDHPEMPVNFGISRLDKRPINDLYNINYDADMFERPSKQFKFDFPTDNVVENAVPDELNHSLVYSRPKKMFTTKNKFTSPTGTNEFYPRQPESRRKLNYSYSSQPVMEVYNDPVPLVHQKAACSAFQGFRKPKYSPRDYRLTKCAEQGERVPFKVRFSPNELNLRKKYAPQTLRIDELDENTSPSARPAYFMDLDLEDIPRSRATPDITFKPRFN